MSTVLRMGDDPVSVESMKRGHAYYLFFVLFFYLIPVVSYSALEKKVNWCFFTLKIYFGHLHQNPSRYSSSLTTVSCGHPIKVFEVIRPNMSSLKVINDIWAMVKIGPYDGYMRRDHLSSKNIFCFQDEFPKFFENFDLDISELYHWGRLYDLYVEGKSKVK